MRTAHSRFLLIIFAIAGVTALLRPASLLYAQPIPWSPAIPLSPDGEYAWFPDIAADAFGRVHVVWSSGSHGYDTVMHTSTMDGAQWASANDIVAHFSADGSEATRPMLFADAFGFLHLTYRLTSVYYTRSPAENASLATAWQRHQQISGRQIAYFSDMAMDSSGVLHLVFTENVLTDDCSICYHVFYQKSRDNGSSWSLPTDLSTTTTGAAKPQILIDSQDNVHVVWEAGRGGSYGQLEGTTRVAYTASYDAGKTWTTPNLFAASGDASKNIAIGMRANQLLVAWLALPEDRVYYQHSANGGRSWSSPQPIPDVWGGWTVYSARLDSYAMATDSADGLHLLLVGRTRNTLDSLEVLHLRWDGARWLAPQVVARFTEDVPEWPRIAIANGNQLHATWFVRDKANVWNSDGGQYRVWYAKAMAAAPSIISMPAPTHTPTIAASLEAAVTPTVPPVAQMQNTNQFPDPPARVASVYSEVDEMLLLAQSLLPVLLLAAMVIVHLRRQRN